MEHVSGELETVEARIRLTDEELLERGQQMSLSVQTIASIKARKAEYDKVCNEEIKDEEGAIAILAAQVRSKRTLRSVECLVLRDYDGRRVAYEMVDAEGQRTGEIVKVRPMTEDEMQPGIFEGDAALEDEVRRAIESFELEMREEEGDDAEDD